MKYKITLDIISQAPIIGVRRKGGTKMITLEKQGRRVYLIGNTYPIKDQIKNAGGKWDADRKAWWVGVAKQSQFEKFTQSESTATNGNGMPALTPSSEIIGRAQYKEREYLLVWEGETKRGPAAKLAFRDGSKVFWASRGEYRVIKHYREPMTLRQLDRFAAEKKAEREANERAAEIARKRAERTPEQVETDKQARVTRIAVLAETSGAALIQPVKQFSYDRREKGGVDVGEIISRKKDGTHWMVIEVDEPYYMSDSDCEQAEDMGHFGAQRGWVTQYTAVQIEEPAAIREAREQAATAKDAESVAYTAALAPAADYRKRHGATLGGVVTMSNEDRTESFSEPRMISTGSSSVEWEQVAYLILDTGSTGSCAGRVMNSKTLYRAILPDGRPIFREDYYGSFGDDLRTTFYLPADIFDAACRAEIAANGITPESAKEWLAKYRGCVGTELYEIAAEIPRLTA
jgi:hypothetical protein